MPQGKTTHQRWLLQQECRVPRPGVSTCQPRRHRRPQAKKSCTSWADDWKQQVGCTVTKEQESRSQGFQHTPRSTNKRRRSIVLKHTWERPHVCTATCPTASQQLPHARVQLQPSSGGRQHESIPRHLRGLQSRVEGNGKETGEEGAGRPVGRPPRRTGKSGRRVCSWDNRRSTQPTESPGMCKPNLPEKSPAIDGVTEKLSGSQPLGSASARAVDRWLQSVPTFSHMRKSVL